jgi:hypothetical protein
MINILIQIDNRDHLQLNCIGMRLQGLAKTFINWQNVATTTTLSSTESFPYRRLPHSHSLTQLSVNVDDNNNNDYEGNVV